MKQVLRTAARWGMSRARKKIRNIDGQHSPGKPVREVFDVFTDSRGQQHELIKGYRDYLKPDWRLMFSPPAQSLSESELLNAPIAGRKSIHDLRQRLSACGVGFDQRKVLEVGCYLGTRAFALAAYAGCEVTAIDLPEYYVQQNPNEVLSSDVIARETARLATLRELIRTAFATEGASSSALERVTFADQDISTTSLPSGYFDAIVSWEVLEHLRDPEAVFVEMARLLKPGGVSFHEYNPFFCIEGGHSLCTLDFPYGHARLSASDFEAYLRRYRAEEAEVALRFFHKNLNRMTLTDLMQISNQTGFDVFGVIHWPEIRDLAEIDQDTLNQVRATYSKAKLEDLLSRRIWVILKKPY